MFGLFLKKKFQMSCVKTAAVWWEGAELGLSVNATAALMPLLFELSCGRSTSAASVEHRNMSEKENAAFFLFPGVIYPQFCKVITLCSVPLGWGWG